MSKRILVVEDQPDNRQIIRDMLAGTNYEMTEAEDGEQAGACSDRKATTPTHTNERPTADHRRLRLLHRSSFVSAIWSLRPALTRCGNMQRSA